MPSVKKLFSVDWGQRGKAGVLTAAVSSPGVATPHRAASTAGITASPVSGLFYLLALDVDAAWPAPRLVWSDGFDDVSEIVDTRQSLVPGRRQFSVEWGAAGAVGSLGWSIIGPAAVILPRSLAGVVAAGVDGQRYTVDVDVTAAMIGAEIVWDNTIAEARESVEGGAPLSAPLTPVGYLSATDADALAVSLPAATLPAWGVALADAKAAALELASAEVDAAGPYQGRRYDAAQLNAFPRMAYGMPQQIWDWDAVTNTAVVPLDVRRAVLYQAESILAGTRERQQDALHDRLASQSVGGLSESYFPAGGASDSAISGSGVLARRAALLLAKYRLRSGRLL